MYIYTYTCITPSLHPWGRVGVEWHYSTVWNIHMSLGVGLFVKNMIFNEFDELFNEDIYSNAVSYKYQRIYFLIYSYSLLFFDIFYNNNYNTNKLKR